MTPEEALELERGDKVIITSKKDLSCTAAYSRFKIEYRINSGSAFTFDKLDIHYEYEFINGRFHKTSEINYAYIYTLELGPKRPISIELVSFLSYSNLIKSINQSSDSIKSKHV